MSKRRKTTTAAPSPVPQTTVSGGGWECSACTFSNAAAAYRCDVCGTGKGTSSRKLTNLSAMVVQEACEQQIQQEKKKTSRAGSGGPTASDSATTVATRALRRRSPGQSRAVSVGSSEEEELEEEMEEDEGGVSSASSEEAVKQLPRRRGRPARVRGKRPTSRAASTASPEHDGSAASSLQLLQEEVLVADEGTIDPIVPQARRRHVPLKTVLGQFDRSNFVKSEVSVDDVRVVITEFFFKGSSKSTSQS